MSDKEIGSIVLALSVLLASVHILGYFFERLKQPRLIGEILAGVLLGPYVLGQLAPEISNAIFGLADATTNKTKIVITFIYWIGLLLLMFLAGSETRKLLSKENQRETAWLLGVGTPLPFFIVLFLGIGSFLPLEQITGSSGQQISALLVLAIAVAVTSIPVISRIFFDLNILHTRFASLILGTAVLEDIILWGVLAVSSSLATSALLANEHLVPNIVSHVGTTFLYMGLCIFIMPKILKYLHSAKWNILVKASPVGYIFFILFIYASIAAIFKVNIVFAAFLAGFGLVGGVDGSQRQRFSEELNAIAKIASAIFIPIYFAHVGYKLLLGVEFSFSMFLIFLLASSFLSLLSVGLAAKLAGFKKLDILNLAITTNARGGPGIVLASIAYDTGIINAAFYTTLVLTAIITSQVAGVWLRFVLSKGWPLLSSDKK